MKIILRVRVDSVDYVTLSISLIHSVCLMVIQCTHLFKNLFDTLTESGAFKSGAKQKVAQPYRGPRGLNLG